jgi:hypothetical protein
MNMKKLFLFLALGIFCGVYSSAYALPMLQLDISNGYYDTQTDTVFASNDNFTLYALLNSKNNQALQATYFIAAALVGPHGTKVSSPGDYGSFTIGGASYDATTSMTYGNPFGSKLKHGIYATYYNAISFKFDPNNTATAYNTADSPGGFMAYNTGNFLYYAPFQVDTSRLAHGYSLHFDLYSKNNNGKIDKFAPFSHDAQSAHAPIPPSVWLFGSGLVGLIALRRFRIS